MHLTVLSIVCNILTTPSIFGNLGFSKKKVEAEAAPVPPAKDVPAEPAAVSETAPVIPAVEATEPLSAEVAPAADAPAAEAAPEAAAAATNGEKKDVKSDKRKSSLPFNFGGKKEKSDDEGEKKSSGFSRLRNTVRLGRKDKSPGPAKTEEAAAAVAEDKPAEAEAAVEEPAAAVPAEAEAAAPAPAVEEAAADVPKAIATAPIVAATA